MYRKILHLLLAVGVVANVSCAAPAKTRSIKAPAKKPVPAVKKVAAVIKPSTPARGDTTVHITAATRNETAAKTELVLAEKNKASVPIIISAKASDGTKAVAADLADILKRMSGATFEIKPGDGKTGLVLGNITDFPNPALDEALKIYNGFDGKEAYAIRVEAKRVLLLGATDKGASHAAYRFLHELGYRSFFPDKVWEVVPTLKTLSFGKDITDRPEILSRDIWFEAGSGSGPANEDYRMWKIRNFQAQSFVANAGHNLFVVPGMFPEEFKAHPEYYAQNADGTPILDDIELTNPGARKLVVEYARRFFKENPNADMVSIDPADRLSHSQSPEALKTSYSDQIFGMANEVAKMLQKEFPGKMVGLYSYNAHWDPPSFNLEPNVNVLMTGLGQGKYTPAERDRIWRERSHNRGAYEYYGVFLWHYDKMSSPSGTNYVEGLQQGLQGYSTSGVTSISGESTSNWGRDGRGYMTATALMWNPHLDLKAFLNDFYTKAFGPGAPAMKRYYERLTSAPFYSKQLIGQAFRDVNEASELAKGRPDVQARLDFVKTYLNYAYMEWAQNRDGKQGFGEKIPRLYYASRDRAVFSFEMARQTWWGGVNWDTDFYKAPYTHEELEQTFQEGLAYFPVRTDIGDPISYTKNLVPIDWTAAQKGTAPVIPQVDKDGKDLGIFQTYQGGAKYALYSVKGEPLKFSTWAGDAWGGINRLTVTDANGVEVFKKDKIPNKADSTHNIGVPGPGLYWLDYNDNGSYWSMRTPDGMIATIPLGQTQDYRNMWTIPTQMFFYVPKGIKNIEYFYQRTNFHPGGPHKVVDPNGKVVKDVDVNGDWVTVPVPAGMDGKLWSFQNPVVGIFNFNNIPNYYAPTKDGLMVPSEVAAKDGLTLRK